ncbi:MAG: DUF87 domain-containing protein [Candidatus Cloacimonetes bacterium]|nr:DUF87 domain-containing protein [Candidatus Cloacimonadota bacterium]
MSEVIQVDPERTIRDSVESLAPWWNLNDKNILQTQTENNPRSYLDSYYLFPWNEISVNSDCDDVPGFINERFHNLLAAASHSGLSVVLLLSSKNGRNEVFLGLKNQSPTENDRIHFESIVNGIFPGKKITSRESICISALAEGYEHGGVVTGAPVLKKDDEKQRFNLSSVARSLYGQDYLLAILSRPISETDKKNSFGELIQIRDRLHAVAKQTVGKETGSVKSDSENSTKGSSETSGHSVGVTFGAGVPTPFGFIGAGGSYNHNESKTTTESTSKGTTHSEQESKSLSMERQNGYALELEKIAEQYIKRVIQGFGSGYWETTITFATKHKMASDILAGAFAGELSKPGDKLLPPPRFFLDNLGGRALFIPKANSSNSIFPKSLSSYITSEELSLISSPPTESVPGYEIQKIPSLSLTDSASRVGIKLGSITDHGNPIPNNDLFISEADLNKHLFICGLTGSGKTSTVKHILKSLAQAGDTPFLVLESAKRDYRQLLADDVFNDKLSIFTIGDAGVSPIRFNPFYIQKGVHPLVHIDYLKALFNASFSLYGPMPSIVEKCLHLIYIKKGWDLTLGTHPNFLNRAGNFDENQYSLIEHYYCFPTLTDLKDEVDFYIQNKLNYQGELRDNIRTAIVVRLESLCVGAKGLMFNTHDFFSISDLLSKNTILEMESLADDDDKAFFVGLVLVLISEYRQKENPAVNPGMGKRGLRHFMVIEEAHRLLKNVNTERTSEMMGNPKGKAVEVFCNILAEMRSLGQGVAVVEQIPSKISADVIKNSNTKIVHRLVSKDDQSLLAASLSIDDMDALYLNRLTTGHALCHKEGMGRPVECKVLNDVASHAVSDSRIKRLMSSLTGHSTHDYRTYEIASSLNDDGKELVVRLFNSLVTQRPDELKDLIVKAKSEVLRQLTLMDVSFRINEDCFSDYFVLQIMLLLSRGIYCRKNPFPNNLKKLLLDILNNPSEKQQIELIYSLNNLWKPAPAHEFIENVVENLSLKYIRDKGAQSGLSEIESVISSFLLVQNQKLVTKVSLKIQCQMEVIRV